MCVTSAEDGVCRSDISTKNKFILSPSSLFFMLCSISSPHLLFHICSCLELLLIIHHSPGLGYTPFKFACALFFSHLFLEFSFIHCFLPLAAIHSFPLPFSPLACLRLALPSFDFSHLFFRLPSSFFCSSPSFHISTSDEQWGGDCSASLCSHFMLWLQNCDGRKVRQRGEDGCEHQERVITLKVETKKNKKGMKRGTSTKQRESTKGMFVYHCLCKSTMGNSASRAALQTMLQRQHPCHCLRWVLPHDNYQQAFPQSCVLGICQWSGCLWVSRSLSKGQHQFVYNVFMFLFMQ